MSNDLNTRIVNDKSDFKKIREKYNNRVPCIVKIKGKNVPRLIKEKYLVPFDLSFGQFAQIVRKYFSTDLKPTVGLFWFINNEIISMSKLISELDKEYSKDGALYIECSLENTFG